MGWGAFFLLSAFNLQKIASIGWTSFAEWQECSSYCVARACVWERGTTWICDGICGLIDSNALSTFCRLLFATMLDGNVHIVVNPVAGEASFSLSWGTIFDAFQYMFDVTCVCVWNWCKCTFCSMLLSGNLPSTKKKCLLLKLRRLRCAVWSSSDDCVTVSQAVRVFD